MSLGVIEIGGLILSWAGWLYLLWLFVAMIRRARPFDHPDLPQQTVDELQSMMRSQQKLAAVRRYRELTGCGLRDAKDFVECL